MTQRVKAGIFASLLLVLFALLGRLWLVNTTSAESLEKRINLAFEQRPDLPYRVEIGATHLGLTGGSFTATEIVLLPDTAWFGRLGREGKPLRNQFAVLIPRIEFTGIGRLSLLRGAISIREIRVYNPDLQIQLDRRIPASWTGDTVPLPHERLLDAGKAIQVGQVQVVSGRIRYFERAPDGARFGQIHFDSVNASVGGITNAEGGGSTGGIVAIELATLVAGKARMTSSIRYDVRTPGANLAVSGGMGPANARIFNPMLADLEGVRVTGGEIDTVRWNIDIKDNVAAGEFLARYRDFSVEIQDKVTRDRNLEDRLVSFIGNNFKINTANPSHKDGRAEAAPLAQRRAPDIPLIKFLWVTLRTGIVKTIGL